MILFNKRKPWTRNIDHILVCDHGQPLHSDECVMCELDRQQRETERAANISILIFIAAVVAVFMLAGGVL